MPSPEPGSSGCVRPRLSASAGSSPNRGTTPWRSTTKRPIGGGASCAPAGRPARDTDRRGSQQHNDSIHPRLHFTVASRSVLQVVDDDRRPMSRAGAGARCVGRRAAHGAATRPSGRCGLTLVGGRDYDSNRLVDRPSQPAYLACRRPRRRDRRLSGGGAHAARPSRPAGSRRIDGSAARAVSEARSAAADRLVQDPRRLQRRPPADAGAAERRRLDGQRRQRRAGRGVRRAAGRRALLGDGDGHGARHQDPRDRAARRHDRPRDATTNAGARSNRTAPIA